MTKFIAINHQKITSKLLHILWIRAFIVLTILNLKVQSVYWYFINKIALFFCLIVFIFNNIVSGDIICAPDNHETKNHVPHFLRIPDNSILLGLTIQM